MSWELTSDLAAVHSQDALAQRHGQIEVGHPCEVDLDPWSDGRAGGWHGLGWHTPAFGVMLPYLATASMCSTQQHGREGDTMWRPSPRKLLVSHTLPPAQALRKNNRQPAGCCGQTCTEMPRRSKAACKSVMYGGFAESQNTSERASRACVLGLECSLKHSECCYDQPKHVQCKLGKPPLLDDAGHRDGGATSCTHGDKVRVCASSPVMNHGVIVGVWNPADALAFTVSARSRPKNRVRGPSSITHAELSRNLQQGQGAGL